MPTYILLGNTNAPIKFAPFFCNDLEMCFLRLVRVGVPCVKTWLVLRQVFLNNLCFDTRLQKHLHTGHNIISCKVDLKNSNP